MEPLLRNGNIKAAGQQYVDKSRIEANSGQLLGTYWCVVQILYWFGGPRETGEGHQLNNQIL